METEIETMNDQLVSVSGDYISILRPKRQMTKTEALRLAGWLVALADEDHSFTSVLAAIQNT